ncbi:MAG: YbhB/YbcL family Raf kinase inhibitor-like protein [Nocardioidaceae bacterium]
MRTRACCLGLLGTLLTLVGLAGCGGSGSDSAGPTEPTSTAPESMTVTSSAIQAGQPIPTRFTCDGAGVSPPLSWSGTPNDARAVALVVDDPDAPDQTFVHWVLLDIPPATHTIAAGKVPHGASQATGSSGKASYFAPCPPSGTHHYRFTVYALSAKTGLGAGTGMDKALHAITSAASARGRLVATYQSS